MPREGYDVVHRVVNTVDHQTGGPQRDRIPRSKLVLILSVHGNETSDRVREAIEEAIDRGELDFDDGEVWIPE